MQTRIVRHDEFARFHVAQVGRADNVESRNFRGEDVAAVKFTDNERSHPVGVAQPDDLGFVHDDDGEAALEFAHHLRGGVL